MFSDLHSRHGTGDHECPGCDREETRRPIGVGTHTLTIKVIPVTKAGTPGERFGEQRRFRELHPEHKVQMLHVLRDHGWSTGMTRHEVSGGRALKKTNAGIAVEGATHVANGTSGTVLTSPGLSVVVEAIEFAQMIFQRMK